MNNVNLENSLEKLDEEMRRLNTQKPLLKMMRQRKATIYRYCAYRKIQRYGFSEPEKCEDAINYLNRIKLNPLYEKPFVWLGFEYGDLSI